MSRRERRVRYTFRDRVLDLCLCDEGCDRGEVLGPLLDEFSWIRTGSSGAAPDLSVEVRARTGAVGLPATARELFCADEFRGLNHGDDFYLADGDSLLAIEGGRPHAVAILAPSFFEKPVPRQRAFWAFVLMRLLRRLELYVVHAAGLVAPSGGGILVVGGSGSGKSTLALELVRRGYGFLSDDTVLVSMESGCVEALALRRGFSVDPDAPTSFLDLPAAAERPRTAERTKRSIPVEQEFPGQRVAECRPESILFASLDPTGSTSLVPMDAVPALRALLDQSGSQLFERATMGGQLRVLGQLTRQAALYELRAGADLYERSDVFPGLIDRIEGSRHGADRRRAHQ